MLLPTVILAQSGPTPAESWNVFEILVAILAAVLVVLKIVDLLKTKPPVHEKYETMQSAREREQRLTMKLEELVEMIHDETHERQKQDDQLRAEWLNATKEIFQRLDGVNTDLKGIQRTLGRLEGAADNK